MAVKLNRSGFDHAKELIVSGRFVFDERDAWSEHQPSAQQENDFIDRHGIEEFGKWHLGINDEKDPHTKGRYEFPYGDFVNVHRCGVLSAESRAGQYKHFDIENAARCFGRDGRLRHRGVDRPVLRSLSRSRPRHPWAG